MEDYILNSSDGEEIAARLDVEIFIDVDRGDDGKVFLLEDGRILKVTSSKQEAALALAMHEAQARGEGFPGLPKIDGVYWFKSQIEVQGTLYDFENYVLLREDMQDLFFDDEEQEAIWKYCLRHLNWGWSERDQKHIDHALESWDGPQLREVYDGLLWAEQHFGIRILDIRASNLGISPSGMIGMRDLSRGEVPEPRLQRVKSLDFERMPPMPERGLKR
jgi:hypothetical protein